VHLEFERCPLPGEWAHLGRRAGEPRDNIQYIRIAVNHDVTPDFTFPVPSGLPVQNWRLGGALCQLVEFVEETLGMHVNELARTRNRYMLVRAMI
jgi:hypothetical protein